MERRINAVFLLLPMLVFGFLYPAYGEKPKGQEQESQGVFNLGEVVVQGQAEPISQVGTVDTVSQAELNKYDVTNVSDAINSLPGVTISVGQKNERNFSIRGFSQRYFPVFWDGIPIYVPADGYVEAGKLPIGSVSKITVTKGISSVLYGFNTMGGVVNIISRKPEKVFEGNYHFEASEVNSWNGYINLGSKVEKLYATLGGGYLDSAGFRLSDKFTKTTTEDGGTRNNSDVNRLTGSFKIGWTPSDGHEYALGVNTIGSEYGLPPNTSGSARFWRFTDWKKDTYYFIGDSKIADTASLQTRLYHDEYYNLIDSYDNETYTTQNKKSAFHSTYDDFSNGGSIVMKSTWIPKNAVSFSFHYKEDVHREQDNYGIKWERYEQKMVSYGLEDSIKFNDYLAFVAGASYDIQEPEYANGGSVRDSVDAFNPQAGILIDVLKDGKVHLSWGRKTRFPNLFELYSEQFGSNVKNPTLKEEKANNYEVGFVKPFLSDNIAKLTLFYSDVEDKIVKRNVTSTTTKYENIGQAIMQGAELSFSSKMIKDNELEINYSYIDAQDRSANRTSDYIQEIPEHRLFISDMYTINDMIALFAKAQTDSKTWYQESTTQPWKSLPAFWTADAKVIFTVNPKLIFEVGVRNIFDENYELSIGFPREGRSLFGIIRGSF